MFDEVKDDILDEIVSDKDPYITFKLKYKRIEDRLVPIVGSKANPFVLYFKMRTMIIRDGWKDHKDFPLKKDYYDNGYLVMSMSMRKMAEEFEVNYESVRRAVNRLVDNSWVKVVRHQVKGNYYGQYIYIFGTWKKGLNGKPIEEYYSFIEE